MSKTSIEWTDESINPLRADLAGRTGHYCEKISPGCLNCYSSRMQRRFGMPSFQEQRRNNVLPWIDTNKLLEVARRRKPTKFFWCDMTDLFGRWVPDEWIDQCFAAMAWTPQHTHQLLTKRADRALEYSAGMARLSPQDRAARLVCSSGQTGPFAANSGLDWPLPNVWLGVSVEDQVTADERIPLLLQTPAAVRFVSYEPALGPVDFRRLPGDGDERYINALTGERGWTMQHVAVRPESGPRLDWIIVGGESGPGARPFDVAWARSAVWQCREPGTACFIKQLGARRGSCPVCGHPDEAHGIGRTVGCQAGDGSEQSPICGCRKMRGEIDHRMGDSYARHAPRDRKGGDWLEWPEDLRVRQFPEVTHA